MILLAREYLKGLLVECGIPAGAIYTNPSAAEQMKPPLWALIDNPEPENYEANYERWFTDERPIDGEWWRTYHFKYYDASVLYSIKISGMKDEVINGAKRELLQKLVRWIIDSKGYRVDVIPVFGDFNPEDADLSTEPQFEIKIRFVGGLWSQRKERLLQNVAPEGEIVRDPKRLEDE